MNRFLSALFSKREKTRQQNLAGLEYGEIPLSTWNADDCEPLTVEEYLGPHLHPDPSYRKIVANTRSFADLLNPRIDLGDNRIGLQDLKSVGKLFEVRCTSTEALSTESLQAIYEKVHHAIARSCPEDISSPWIMQWFVKDDSEFISDQLTRQIEAYSQKFNPDSKYAKYWLSTLKEHILDLTDSDGLFSDHYSVNNKWRGKKRTVRLCVWRVAPPQRKFDENAIGRICVQLNKSLAQANIQLIPCGADKLYEWLTRWFVPSPEKYTGFSSTTELLKAYPWSPSDLDRSASLYSNSAKADIGRASLHGAAPWTWKKPGVWWFRGQPTRFITIDELVEEPKIGHLTGELQFGESVGTLWDQMPENSIWSMTVVYTPQHQIEAKILKVKSNAIGDGPVAVERRKLSDTALNEIARGNPIYRVFSGVYVFGSNLQDLDRKTEQVLATLTTHKLRPVSPRYDPVALDSYIRALPFGYDFEQDKRPFAQRGKLWLSTHIARMVPVYGRSTGTNFPGCIFFNRGAEPIMFDPLNSVDRVSNAHCLVLGPTGSGKTAMIIYILLHALAIHRPRMFLITAVPTFGLFVEHCQRLGLKVHRVQIDGKSRVTLPPFGHAQVLLSKKDNSINSDASALRDPLGEMELQARLMITGGQVNEENNLRRDDLDIIRATIIEAAQLSRSENRSQTLTSDLVRSLYRAAESGKLQNRVLTANQIERVVSMAGAINVFCTGFNGELFDREGSFWPLVDITVVELDVLTRRGYEDKLAVALTGLFSAINNQIESQQYRERQTIVVIDEAHILLQNPLVSPYVNRISAMWRTFGAWLWIATQNLRQFPDNAKELLNQPEWWFCLSMDRDDVDQIGRFKSLTPQQKNLLLSARKLPGLYTEGVIIAARLLTLFRNTPPALALALSQTDKKEKARRAQIMKRQNVSELEAAYVIARKLRKSRKNAKTT